MSLPEPSAPPVDDPGPFRIGNVAIRAVAKDILSLGVDAIVNSAGTRLTMSSGLSAQLKKAGGRFQGVAGRPAPEGPGLDDAVILADLRKHRPVQAGRVYLTTAGALPGTKYILHAVVNDWSRTPQVTAEDVRETTADSLRLAETLRLRSIALPALGGRSQSDVDVADLARAMVESAFETIRELNPAFLREVYLADLHPERLAILSKTLAHSDLPAVQAFARHAWPELVEAHLHLVREAGGFEVRLDTTSGLHIELKDSDAARQAAELLGGLEAFAQATLQQNDPKLDPATMAEASVRLVATGRSVLNVLFKPNTPIRRTILQWRKPRPGGIDSNQALLIEGSEVDSLPIPWELLADADSGRSCLDDPLAALWGFQLAIARRTFGSSRPYIPPVLDGPQRRRGLLFLGHADLEQGSNEFTAVEGHFRLRGVPCRRIESILKPGWQKESHPAAAIWEALDGFDFIHFACHATSDEAQASRTHLAITLEGAEVVLSLRDLEALDGMLDANPIVFLNACETGRHPEFETRYLARHFLDRGARAMVATVIPVPDSFAVPFAARFYRTFLQGQYLHQALRQARTHFLRECHNPLGLAYVAYTDPQVRIGWS